MFDLWEKRDRLTCILRIHSATRKILEEVASCYLWRGHRCTHPSLTTRAKGMSVFARRAFPWKIDILHLVRHGYRFTISIRPLRTSGHAFPASIHVPQSQRLRVHA